MPSSGCTYLLCTDCYVCQHQDSLDDTLLYSITIMGASWTMLAIGYHVSMPAMMGFMLLSGVIVNNAILLIHFAIDQVKQGMNKRDAMSEAITRPVLMTAFAVSVGILPVAQGAAIGLERLAPLGAVAIGGLVVGTFMTFGVYTYRLYMDSKRREDFGDVVHIELTDTCYYL